MYDHSIGDDVTAAAERLRAARNERAKSRRRVRGLLDAMEREAQRRLSGIFADDDPITGRPVCLLIKSDDRMGDEYEAESPRAIPDSHSRLTIEILGRVLFTDIDDFGRVHLEGLPGIDGLHHAAIAGDDVVFSGDADAQRVPFAALLARLIDRVSLDERTLLPVPGRSPDTAAGVRSSE